MKLLSLSDIRLGEGRTREFTVIEIKRLFSVIVYKWETEDQIRFHSHAFPSVAILLWGWYEEEVLQRGLVYFNLVNRWLRPRWLPRDYTHSIKRSAPLTVTLNLRGPWSKTWREYFPDTNTWVTYGWGRKKLSKQVGPLA